MTLTRNSRGSTTMSMYALDFRKNRLQTVDFIQRDDFFYAV